MAKTRTRWGLQGDTAINGREAFDILGQPKRAGKVKPRWRIETQYQPIACFFCPIDHRFWPIHHHSAIGRVAAHPKADCGPLLSKSRNAQGDPE
jgi:hypothetical protein